jgi:hypothetical protein
MKPRVILGFLIVLFLSACNYTFEIGMEHSFDGTAAVFTTKEAGAVATNVAGTSTSTQLATLAPGLQATKTLIPPPGAFAKTAPANGAGSITDPILSWSQSSGAKGYAYCYDTTNNNVCDTSWISTGPSTSAYLGVLSEATTYYWQVRALASGVPTDADRGTWWSFTTQSTTPQPGLQFTNTPPPSPGAFTKIAPASGSGSGSTANPTANPTLSWSASSGAKGYFYCYDTINNNACDTAWISTGTATSATLSGLSMLKTYYWQVRAASSGVYTEADGGTWWSFTTGKKSPGAFTKIAPANGAGSSTNPTLSWSETPGVSYGYSYCYDTTNNNACDTSWVDVGISTSANLSGLSDLTTYFWQVRAGNSVIYTEADGGTWWSFTTNPSSPGAFVKIAPANGAGSITDPILSWSQSSGAKGYAYCYDTLNNNSCDTSWVDVGTSTSANLSGLSDLTTYFWQVRAGNSGVYTEADGGTWWAFTTSMQSPGAFSKIAPANGANSTPASRYFDANLMFFPSIAYFVTTGKAKEPLLCRFRGMRNAP